MSERFCLPGPLHQMARSILHHVLKLDNLIPSIEWELSRTLSGKRYFRRIYEAVSESERIRFPSQLQLLELITFSSMLRSMLLHQIEGDQAQL
jgi:hypothetical protein